MLLADTVTPARTTLLTALTDRTFITYGRLYPGTCRLYAYAIDLHSGRRPEHRFSNITTDTDEHPHPPHAHAAEQYRLTHASRHHAPDGSRSRDVRSGLSTPAREPDGRTQRGDAEDGRRGRLNRLEDGNAGSDRDARSEAWQYQSTIHRKRSPSLAPLALTADRSRRLPDRGIYRADAPFATPPCYSVTSRRLLDRITAVVARLSRSGVRCRLLTGVDSMA